MVEVGMSMSMALLLLFLLLLPIDRLRFCGTGRSWNHFFNNIDAYNRDRALITKSLSDRLQVTDQLKKKNEMKTEMTMTRQDKTKTHNIQLYTRPICKTLHNTKRQFSNT